MTLPEFLPEFNEPSGWAAMYRAAGMQVIPGYLPFEMPANWKRPKLSEWKTFQEELINSTVFTRWYGPQGEHAERQNMGVICGRCSDNLLVIDLDVHKNPQAWTWWQGVLALDNAGMELETCEQRTGGGGMQIFFRAPAGWIVPTCKTAIGVDIRGQGGFAVLPPSLHDSGQQYAWVAGRAPWELEIAIAPGWLMDAIDVLVDAHGGDTRGNEPRPAAAPGQAPPPGEDRDAFGHFIDGREQEMRDVVWHAALELFRACPIKPPEGESERAMVTAYLRYEDRVSSRLAGDKREGLEREGRGPTAFRQKWRSALRKWDKPEFRIEAERPAPVVEPAGPRASEPPPPRAGLGLDADFPSPNPTPTVIPLLSAFPIDEATLPVRDWSVPGLLLRRNLSVLIAPPAAGKSLLTLQLAIAIAAGIEWGGWKPRRREKVLIINAEDDVDEMRRRLVAAAREMGIDQALLDGWILLVEAPETILIARMDARTKTVIRMPLIETLIETIVREGIGITIADPFAETFEGDENSNSEVKWAGILWREVARRTVSSLLLVHHTRKYAGDMAGVADASRGGGALIGTARVMCSLMTMTEEEAKARGILEEERGDYARFDDAKANYSKLERERWFKKKTITLNNATAFVVGDEVGVFVPWVPPGALEGVSTADINKALDAIDVGMLDEKGKPTGQFFTATATSLYKERWAGNVLIAAMGMSEANAKGLIKKWLENEVLEVLEYNDPVQHKLRKGVHSVLHNRPGREEKYE